VSSSTSTYLGGRFSFTLMAAPIIGQLKRPVFQTRKSTPRSRRRASRRRRRRSGDGTRFESSFYLAGRGPARRGEASEGMVRSAVPLLFACSIHLLATGSSAFFFSLLLKDTHPADLTRRRAPPCAAAVCSFPGYPRLMKLLCAVLDGVSNRKSPWHQQFTPRRHVSPPAQRTMQKLKMTA
jgi:hypothetical protein